jgi:glyoxylase-like metal-dependent hydrolase (beta-lactamase superfamily II)
VTFEREHALDLGGVGVRILAMGHNHTRGDTAAFVTPDRVLFSGDVSMVALPAVGGASRIAQWIASQERFEALGPGVVVPSHGPRGDASTVARNKAFLIAVRDRVAALKKQGVGLDEVLKTLQAELEPRFGASNRTAGTIRAAFAEAP